MSRTATTPSPSPAPVGDPEPGPSRFWPSGPLFAVIPLLVAALPSAAAFALNPDVIEDIALNEVPVPAWVFIWVWRVIYPCMGVSAWLLWRRRAVLGSAVWVPLSVLLTSYLHTLLFWLSDGLRSVAAADATGVLLAAATVFVVSRHFRAAALWLLPFAVWMPITLGVKIAALAGLVTGP